LLEIKAENPLRLLRVAWHIGNRHTPAEIAADAIYIEEDHVLAEMVRGQGCSVTQVTRPFRPERGAYDHGHAHGHAHASGE
jgi:urease accessory protein